METDAHQSLGIPTLPDAIAGQELFHELDTLLRSGVHVQAAHPEQQHLVPYLRKNEAALAAFYRDWHLGAQLQHRHEEPHRYYFLEPTASSWAQAGAAFQRELEAKHIIVAMLLCKVFLIDLQKPEFDSVPALMHLLAREYEDYRDGLFRQLARVMDKRETQLDNENVQKLVGQCLALFKDLGWLCRTEAGGWRVLPALDRIRDLYQNEIRAMPGRFKTPL